MIVSLHIGPALVLPATRQLFVDGVEQRLGGRAFDLLLALARHGDAVVGKEALYDAVWPGLAVEPNNLSVQVWTLRKALGHRAIATVPRRGYRLALPVEELRLGEPRVDRGTERQGAAAAEPAAGWRDFLARALARLEAPGWVTLVGATAQARGQALRALREASAQLRPVPAWHWAKSMRQAPPGGALWHRVVEGGGLIVAEDLDEPGALALQAARHAAPADRVRILATSPVPLAAARDTLVETPPAPAAPIGLAAPAPCSLRWRPRRPETGPAAGA